jgi:hypothetical protein
MFTYLPGYWQDELELNQQHPTDWQSVSFTPASDKQTVVLMLLHVGSEIWGMS